MANGVAVGTPQQSVPQPIPGASVQAHLGRASRFANGQKRDWSLFFFFRILPQAEVDKDFGQLAQVMKAVLDGQRDLAEEEAQKLLASLHNSSTANAGFVDQEKDDGRDNADAPAQLFLHWLKVVTGADSSALVRSLSEALVDADKVFEKISSQSIPADSNTSVPADSDSAAAVRSRMSSCDDDQFTSRSDTRRSRRNFSDRADAMSALQTLWATLRPITGMLGDASKFEAFLGSYGKTAQEAGLTALRGGLPDVVLYELLRQAAPALWRGGSDRAQRSILRSEEDEPLWNSGQPDETKQPWDATPINFAFTYSGLKALKLDDVVLSTFPEAFKEGMAERAERLGDIGSSAPEHWEGVLGLDRVHGYFTGGFVVGSDSSPVPEAFWRTLRNQVSAFNDRSSDKGQALRARLRTYFKLLGMDILHIELGQDPYVVENDNVKKLEHRKEHFGFRDGISQPFVDLKLRDPAPGGGTPRRNRTWSPLAAGEIYLDQPDEDGNEHKLPACALLRRGSTYLVFRKLEQDVAGFRAFLSKQRPEDPDAQTKLAAQFVGRWPNGTPLVLSPDVELNFGPDSDGFINDFLYAADDPMGAKCPLGAHARRTNPRDIGGTNDVRRHRILRRGIAYGGPLLPETQLGDGNKRGLLFVAANSRIDLQFEVIQSNWINQGELLGQAGLNRCPLTGANLGRAEDAFLEANAIAPVTGVPRFVITRGGDYFFAPGVDALRAIARDPKEIKVDPNAVPYLGYSMGDIQTPKLFKEARVMEYGKKLLEGTPSVIRVELPPLGAEGGSPPAPLTAAPASAPGAAVTFVGQLADVRRVLSMRVGPPETATPRIIYSVSQYRTAIHRFSFGRDMLVSTELGSASQNSRKRMKDILEKAWDLLGPGVYANLDGITKNSIEKALRATAKSKRIDLVHDLASSAVYDVLVRLYGTPGPDWLTELAVSLPFAHQHVGRLQPDWLTAAQSGKTDNVGLATLQIWSILIFLDIVGNYEQQPELSALSAQAASELLAHLGGLVVKARAKGPVPDPKKPAENLLEAFVRLEKPMTQKYQDQYRDSADYYTDVRMLLLELVGTTMANIPATMGSVMDAVLNFNIPLTELIPVLTAPPAFLPPGQPAPGKDEGIDRLIYETTRLNAFIKVLMRTCEQDDVLPSQERVDPASQVKVKKGDVVAALLGVAAFDPRAFPEPKRLSLWPYLPGPQRKIDNYLLFGGKSATADESRDCWGRDKLALKILQECVKAAGRLQHLQKVAGPAGRAKTLVNIVVGLSARFAGVLPDWNDR